MKLFFILIRNDFSQVPKFITSDLSNPFFFFVF